MAFFGKKSGGPNAGNSDSLPFSRIVSSVSHAADACVKRVDRFIGGETDLALSLGVFRVNNEFLYYFLHTVNRCAFYTFGYKKSSKLQQIIVPEALAIGSDWFLRSFPLTERDAALKQMRFELDAAERDYSTATVIEFASLKRTSAEKSLPLKLARNVARVLNSEGSFEVMFEIVTVAYEAAETAKIPELVKATKDLLDDV